MATGRLNGWYAFGLPVGCGKTLSIVSFCEALASYAKATAEGKVAEGYEDISLLVCASKVEALCQLKRDLIASGVPPEWIGLYHTYLYDPLRVGDGNYASEPATNDNDQRRILLTTHQRIHTKGSVWNYNVYRDKPRSLIIYDESLIKSEARAVKIDDLRVGVAHTAAYVKKEDSFTGRKAVVYLTEALEMVDAELKAQEVECRRPKSIILPSLSDQEIGQYKKALDSNYYLTKSLRDLLSMSQEPLRVLRTNQGNGFISYEIKVDEDLQNMIILDASYLIRDLVRKYDNKITELSRATRFKVSYGDVSLHQIVRPGGRTQMEKDFPSNPDKRILSLEIAEIVKTIPEDEGVIIFTYKHRKNGRNGRRGAKFSEWLSYDLKEAGIDVDAKVEVWEQGQKVEKPRLNFLTWGMETSLNDYSWAKNIILVGILHRSHLEIGGLMAGQADNYLIELNREEIREVVRSEVCHCFYQAIGRSHARIVRNGRAGRVKVWYIDKNNKLKEKIKEAGALPGANWHVWKCKHLSAKGKIESLADKINKWLEDNGIKRISTRKLKERMGLTLIPNRTFTHAIEALAFRSFYTLNGRSVVYDNPFE
jgi:hypothetical protein